MSMDPNAVRQSVAQLLQGEVDAATGLVKLLREERDVLSGRDLERLRPLLEQKQEQLTRLGELSRQREDLLKASGYSSDREGLEACTRHNDARGQLETLWQELVALLQECQKQTRINSGIVELSQQHIEQTLHALRGETPQTELYDPKGKTVGGPSSRRLAQA